LLGAESSRVLPWNQDIWTPQRKPFYERLQQSSTGIVRLYVWIDRLESYGLAACESGLASTSRNRLIASCCIWLMRLAVTPSSAAISAPLVHAAGEQHVAQARGEVTQARR
jgi:hypothetical protein